MGINAKNLVFAQQCTCDAPADADAHAANCLRGAHHRYMPNNRPGQTLADQCAQLSDDENPRRVCLDLMLYLHAIQNTTVELTVEAVGTRLRNHVLAAYRDGASHVMAAFDLAQWRPANKRVHSSDSRDKPFDDNELRDCRLDVEPVAAVEPFYMQRYVPRQPSHLLQWDGTFMQMRGHTLWARGAWMADVSQHVSGASGGFVCYAWPAGCRNHGPFVKVRAGTTYLGRDVPVPPMTRLLRTRGLRDRLIAHLTMVLAETPLAVAYRNTPAAGGRGWRTPQKLVLVGLLFDAAPENRGWPVVPVILKKRDHEPVAGTEHFRELAPNDPRTTRQSRAEMGPRPGQRDGGCLSYRPMGEADQWLVWWAVRWANRGHAVVVRSFDSDMLPMLLLQQRLLINPPAGADVPAPTTNGRLPPRYEPSAKWAPPCPPGPPGREWRGVIWLDAGQTTGRLPRDFPAADASKRLPVTNVAELYARLLRRAVDPPPAERRPASLAWLSRVSNPVETFALLCALGKCDFCEGMVQIGPVALDAGLTALVENNGVVAAQRTLLSEVERVAATPRARSRRAEALLGDRRLRETLEAWGWKERTVAGVVREVAADDNALLKKARLLFAEEEKDERERRWGVCQRREWAVGDPRVFHLVEVGEKVTASWLRTCMQALVTQARAFDEAKATGELPMSHDALRDAARARWDDDDTRADRIVPTEGQLLARIRRAAWTLQYWLNGSREAHPPPLYDVQVGDERLSVWGWRKVEGDVELALRVSPQ